MLNIAAKADIMLCFKESHQEDLFFYYFLHGIKCDCHFVPSQYLLPFSSQREGKVVIKLWPSPSVFFCRLPVLLYTESSQALQGCVNVHRAVSLHGRAHRSCCIEHTVGPCFNADLQLLYIYTVM